MRPVLLEMSGFASFREPTRVSFADADYFALVGPTGAGKSTVIDALTFALYGSVARWDREGMVSPALSPTTNRGVVRLVFDASGQRYSVVRELRRSAGKNATVTARNVRLERFQDPDATGAPEDPTEVIAADKAVTPAVEQLLGLDFRQFCTCVALPQGEFAEFLHARAADRQKILINLLGLDVYERISSRARELAQQHTTREQVLGEQLAGFADATEENVTALARRVTELAELRARIDAAVPVLRTTAEQRAAARTTVATLTSERQLLAGITVPDGVTELDAAHQHAATARQHAGEAVAVTEQADRTARAALQAGPDRHALELVRSRRQELATITAELPDLAERVAAATVVERDAEAAESVAVAQAGAARDAHDTLARTAAELDTTASQLRHDHQQLAGLREPAGLAEVVAAGDLATERLTSATAALERAEQADQAARARQASEPDPGTLAAALDTARGLSTLAAELITTTAEVARQDQGLARARAALATALAERGTAADAVARADRADRAVALREHLAVGEPCPVCAQTVATLPEHAPHTDLTAATAALVEAEQRHDKAERAVRTAERAQDRAANQHAGLLDRINQAQQALRSAPVDSGADPTAMVAALTAAADRRTELDQAATAAAADVAMVRQGVATARRAVEQAQHAVTAGRSALRQARDRLATLGAPVLDDADLLAGWRTLTGWATGRRAELSGELATVTDAATRATAEIDLAKQALAEADTAAQHARAASRAALAELQTAKTTLANRQSRQETLHTELADAPDADVVASQLDQLARLERAAADTDRALEHARQRATRAAEEEQRARRLVVLARQELDRARDPLVRFGAPMAVGDALATDWAALVEWASAEADRRATELGTATRTAEDLAATVEATEQRLAADLAEHGIPVDHRPVADAAPVLVATASAEAVAAHDALAQRAADAIVLAATITAARERAQVAKQVADLLRSNNFPRWLVASALDNLVAAASAALLDLSGGQFELTHADGDFLVIDHNEADKTRPVKTLSGGETFQAALALALALSSQIGALAEAGAARLEAIFLDEGFGTLDESTLDTVASTLENLAGSGSRMVGVITHVAALAERVPVRFQVSRDGAGSHVVREDV